MSSSVKLVTLEDSCEVVLMSGVWLSFAKALTIRIPHVGFNYASQPSELSLDHGCVFSLLQVLLQFAKPDSHVLSHTFKGNIGRD